MQGDHSMLIVTTHQRWAFLTPPSTGESDRPDARPTRLRYSLHGRDPTGTQRFSALQRGVIGVEPHLLGHPPDCAEFHRGAALVELACSNAPERAATPADISCAATSAPSASRVMRALSAVASR